MSEINPTDRKSFSARLFPGEDFHDAVRELFESERDNKRVRAEFLRVRLFSNEGFLEAVHESVESEREYKRVEAEFSRVYGWNKRVPRHVWCLDLVHAKDFFERL